MPWYGFAALAAVILGGTPLVVDRLRRQGLPRLSRVRLSSFRGNPVAPDGFYRRLAESITKGEFRKKPLRRKPFVELFPTQNACPHCKGKRRKSWGVAEAGRLVNDVAALARQIKRKRLCLNCLEQLSEITKLVKEPEKEKLEKGKSSLSIKAKHWKAPTFSLGQWAILLFLASLLAYRFAHHVTIYEMRVEGLFLWAGIGIVVVMLLRRLVRGGLFTLFVAGAITALVIKGCGLAG